MQEEKSLAIASLAAAMETTSDASAVLISFRLEDIFTFDKNRKWNWMFLWEKKHFHFHSQDALTWVLFNAAARYS